MGEGNAILALVAVRCLVSSVFCSPFSVLRFVDAGDRLKAGHQTVAAPLSTMGNALVLLTRVIRGIRGYVGTDGGERSNHG